MRMIWRFLFQRSFPAAARWSRPWLARRRAAKKARVTPSVELLEARWNPSTSPTTNLLIQGPGASVSADIQQTTTDAQQFQNDLTQLQTDEQAEEQAELNGTATRPRSLTFSTRRSVPRS